MANTPVSFEVVELDRQQLLVKRFEKFHLSCITEVIADVSILASATQTMLFQSVEDGQARKYEVN